MKPLLLFVLLLAQSLLYSQITFQEITSPADFSLRAVRQSPTGEYFAQAVNDRNSIFTSMNGHDWTWSPLPEAHPLGDIQFYSNGTPVLKNDNYWHVIRRGDTWYSMDVPGAFNKVNASFIKDDT